MNRRIPFNKYKIISRPQAAFSAKIEKKEVLQPLRAPNHIPVDPLPKEESNIPIPQIEEDFLNLLQDQTILFKSCYDPNFKRFVQILKEKRGFSESETPVEFLLREQQVVENYLIEFVDPYTTKITAKEDLLNCIVRIYFCEPSLVGVLEKVDPPNVTDQSNIYEWDVVLTDFNWDEWENQIYASKIGEPFIGGVYSNNDFNITLKDKNGVEHVFTKNLILL